jgi:sec-independent protein translocase protein TatC
VTTAEDVKAAAGDEEQGYVDPPMTIWEHLAELRKRLIIIILALMIFSAASWEFRETLLAFLVKPYVDAWIANGVPGEPMLHFQTPAAAFMAYFKLSMLGGGVICAPIIFYQLWSFVAPGLYAKEKKFVIPFAVSSTLLFVGGGYFGWKLAFPLAFKYLLGLGGSLTEIMLPLDVKLSVTPTVMMGEYISFVTRMLLGFGLIFEIPLFIFFMSVAGIVNYLHLIRYGRWFVVGAFLAAAMLTPPDITSQTMMALPMILLYLLSIALAYVFGKPPSDAQRAAFRARKEEMKKKKKKT